MPILKLRNNLFSLPPRGAQPRVTTEELRLWHKMDAQPWSGSNRMPDSSPIGTNTGALYTGRALDFDGVNDTVDIGNTGQTIKSLVFYVNPDTDTQKFLELQTNGAVDVGCGAGILTTMGWSSPATYVNGVPGSTITAGTWQQVVITSATGISANAVTLGKSNIIYFAGQMTDVRLYSVELTAAQVAELYANPESVLPTGVSSGELVGWWDFSETNAMFLDGTGNKNGTITGPSVVNKLQPIPQNGLKSGSFRNYFNGTDTKITINHASIAPGTGAWSFSFWMFSRVNPINKALFRVGIPYYSSGFSIYFLSTTVIRVVSGGQVGSTIDIGNSEGVLRHIVLSYDGTSLFLYADNVKYTIASSHSFNLTSSILEIGNYDGSAFFWDGIIYDFAYWGAALSDSDVASIYSGADVANISTVNLKLYYKGTGGLNDDWQDHSGNNMNGTVNGTGTTIFLSSKEYDNVDKIGGALNTVNTGELIINADGYELITDDATLDITSAITIEAWVKPFTVSTLQTVIGKNNAYALNITSAGKVQFQRWAAAASGTAESTTALSPDTWYHVCCTYDGTETKIYINGVLDASSTALTGAIDSSTNDLLIGALTTTQQLFAGYIDSVKVYARALSGYEVANNYKAEKNSHQN